LKKEEKAHDYIKASPKLKAVPEKKKNIVGVSSSQRD
jgi:hypothetical protein